MIGSIRVLSYPSIISKFPREGLFISIRDPHAVNTLPDQPNILKMYFLDWGAFDEKVWNLYQGTTNLAGHPEEEYFDRQKAETIYSFLQANKDYTGTLYVNCEAGISRSGAVGEFACNFFEFNYIDFKMLNPHIRPNAFILATLNRLLWEDRGKISIE
jgi:predicted protein tyrosine phosphatase